MRLALRLAALTLLVSALSASAALAHEGNPNFRSEIDGLEPGAPGVTAEVLNYDDSLHLENRGDETVLIEGYEGEPYVRIASDGTVEVNTRSPAYYLNADRYGESGVPPSADPEVAPEWEEVDRTGQFTWHDHRIHYMSRDVPAQVSDEAERTKVFDYRVPIEVGGRRTEITGTLYWVGVEGGFPAAPFIALGAVALVAAAAIIVVRRRRTTGEPTGERREAW